MNSVHACVFLLSIALVACSQASSPPDGEGLPAGLDMLGVLDRLAEDRADVFEPMMISTYDRSGWPRRRDPHLADPFLGARG